jgi:mono/diheme cytochrome c family protein
MHNGPMFAMLVIGSLVCAAPALAQGAGPPGDAANGKRVYMAVGCYQCHGTVGQGSRPTGPHIAPNPLPYEVFAGVVRRPVNVMPPYTTVVLSDQEPRRYLRISAHDTTLGRFEARGDPGSLNEVAYL